MDTVQQMEDDLALDQLIGACRERGYFVLALSKQEKRSVLWMCIGLLYGYIFFGGTRG